MRRAIVAALVLSTVMTTATLADLTIGSTVSVEFDGINPSRDVYIRTPYSGGNYYWEEAGIFNLTVAGADMDAFCIDLQDSANGDPKQYTVKTLADAPDPTAGPMMGPKATALSELLSENWVSGMNADDSAALQLAVWEVVTDWTGSYDLNGGNFMTTSLTSSVSDFLKTINGSPVTRSFVALSSTSYQDYVVEVPSVPVPGAMLLGVLGLGVASARLRRRSAK